MPFPFVCGTQHYAAGVYAVHMQNEHVALIQGDARSGFAVTEWVQDLQPVRKGKFVFRRYNSKYFLDEVWSPGMTSHLHYVKSKAQKKEELASKGSFPTEVQVALLQTPR